MIPVLIIVGSLIAVALGIALFRHFRSPSDDEGPVSMVLLRLTPKQMTEADVRSIGRRLLKLPEDTKVLRMPFPGGNGGEALVLVTQDQPYSLGIVNSPQAYFDETARAKLLEMLDHPQTRRAISEHQAWISIDLFGRRPSSEAERTEVYNKMARVLAELLDDQCLLIYQPAEHKIALINEQCAQLLAQGDAAGAMAVTSGEASSPLIMAKKDDAELNAAIAEARRRLPEVLEAFSKRGEATDAMVKARFSVGPPENGSNEYLWISLTAVDERAKRVTGTVQNNPIDPSIPAKGQPATVSFDDITDWVFRNEAGNGVGLIAEKVLLRRAAGRR